MAKVWLMGLTDAQVKDRQAVYGLNEIGRGERWKALRVLWSQWKSPLVWLLGAAALLTGIWGDLVDMWMILAAVILNTVIGFVQEYRVEKSLEALKSVLAPKAEVYRNGVRMLLPTSELVPGDILFVSNAHKVAADGVVLSEEGLFVSEAILTGESHPVEKHAWSKAQDVVDIELLLSSLREGFGEVGEESKVFMGTEVSVGVAKVMVVNTGIRTEIGMISKRLGETVEERTPLQKKIARLTRWLAVGVLVVGGAVIVSGVVTGKDWITIFPLAVALSVAALPEGLTLSLTVILAIGMRKILDKGGVVRRLSAAEALGSVEVICADKTGTVTMGEMTVTQAVTNLTGEPTREELKTMILDAVLCNDLRDPLEIAMNKWANDHLKGMGREMKVESWERIDSRPFNHQDKLIMTLLKWGGKKRLLVSGAPEIVLDQSNLSQTEKDKWRDEISSLALKGYRLVGFGGKTTEEIKVALGDVKGVEWHGLLVYEDPIRSGVKEAFERVMGAGIMVKVITGDYKETAMAVLSQLGLIGLSDYDKVITGDELAAMSEEELIRKIEGVVLFARTNPEQKLRIVEALRARNLVVAMTGDGVNDAPALKIADVGIVVAEATEVAKETADMVLVKNDFATIVEAIEEGRAILTNFRKVVTYLLSDAFAGILVIMGSLFFDWPLPLLASQILWVNLISDGFPYLALTLEPKDEGLLRQSPKKYSGAILTKSMILVMATISILAGALTLGIFGWYWVGKGADVNTARTVAMAMLGANSLFYVFSTKALDKPVWSRENKMNWWLWLGIGLGWLMLLLAIYWPPLSGVMNLVPIGWADWWWVFLGTVGVVAAAETIKLVRVKA